MTWARMQAAIAALLLAFGLVSASCATPSAPTAAIAASASAPGFSLGLAPSKHRTSLGAALGTLRLSNTSLATGTAYDGTIIGATPLSTITATGLPSSITINGAARTYHYDGTGSATLSSFTLTEALSGTNNPNTINYQIIAPPTYDTSVGNGVDAYGFALLPLRVGAQQYFVNPTGSDSNSCSAAQSASTPKATLASAWTCVTPFNGDHVLLAEGATFNEFIPYVGNGPWDGFNATYPTVIESYDPADPTNTAKHGRGDQRNARPIIAGTAATVSSQGPNYFALRGLDFRPPGNVPQGLGFNADNQPSHGVNYVLIENNIFRYTTLATTQGNQAAATWTGTHFVVRNNGFYGPWDNRTPSQGNTQCVYVGGAASTTLEDNVFYHCGWNPAVTRDDTGYANLQAYLNAGGGNPLEHSFYIQNNTTGTLIRRNLSMEGGGDCGNTRGDGAWTENLFIDCPAAMSLGSGSNNNERPNGVMETASYNAQIGADGVRFGTVDNYKIGWGPNTINTYVGSRVDHNLSVRSDYFGVNTGNGTQSGFDNSALTQQSSWAQYDHNLLWNWVDQGSQLHSFYDQQDSLTPYVHSSYDYNNWDGTSLGTNTNSTGASFTNAYTKSSLYAAIGFTDTASFGSYAYQHPELHPQRVPRALLFAGYGISAPTDVTAPTLSSPTATPGTTTATVGVTTNEANGVLYAAVVKAYSATAPPTLNSPTASATGGALGNGPYYYVVTAVTPSGETLASNEVSASPGGATGTAAGSVALTWSAVTGATDYHVYRGLFSGQDSIYYDVGNVTSYTDTWASTYIPGLPPGTPDAFHVKVGIDNSNTAAAYSGSQTISSTGAKSFTTGTLSNGSYYAYFEHEDAAGNKSGVSATSLFTIGSSGPVWDTVNSTSSSFSWSNTNHTFLRTSTSGWATAVTSSTISTGSVAVQIVALDTGNNDWFGLTTIQTPGNLFLGNDSGFRDIGYNPHTGAVHLGGNDVTAFGGGSYVTAAATDTLTWSWSGSVFTLKKNGTTTLWSGNVDTYYAACCSSSNAPVAHNPIYAGNSNFVNGYSPASSMTLQ